MHQGPQQNNIKAIIPDQQARQKAMLTRLPKPITTIRKEGNKFLKELLENCFSSIDDTLFDLAKNAVKQQDQDDYFFAMREIRSQKEAIVQEFIQGIKNKYCSLAIPVDDKSYIVTSIGSVSFDELAVVDNDDMDEIVALEAMASRAVKANEHSLKLLANRIKAVVPADPESKDLPVSPSSLCETFAKSVKTIDISSKSTLVLFKLFEKTIVNQLGQLYQIMNTMLAERGILPEGRSQSQESKREHSQTEHDGTGGLHMPVETFGITERSAGDIQKAEAPNLNSVPIATILESMTEQHLTQTQKHGQRNFLSNLIKHFSGKNGDANIPQLNVSTKERNLITILDSLFNTVDDQAKMPEPVKLLFNQLQLPLAKVALTDQTFFTNPKHGARQLLNTLSSSAVRLDTLDADTLNKDPLFRQIKTTVDSLARTQEPSAQDFSKQLNLFGKFKEEESHREALFEQQLIRAEQGKLAFSKTGSLVDATISEVCQGMAILDSVNDIIQNAWRRVMIYSASKHGEESEQWDDNLETLIELVTSTQTYANQIDLAQAEESLKELKTKITEGLLIIGHDAFKTAKMLKRLEVTFESLCSPIQNKAQTKDKEIITDSMKKLDEQTETKSTIDLEKPEPIRVSVSEAFLKQAKNLNRGTWFDLEADCIKTRCRLAAIIEPHERYIFVNTSGAKVSSNSLEEVASMLQNQALVYLDSSHIFDSALEKVISGIKGTSDKAPNKAG